ncbi:Protein MEMO1 [Amphibalanus amphitrite]|uniref:Protein MEMO1 n=1 Tax=Amphibalanus amphitrite TaxID=1232801 RepID=A0A6A4VPL9_AMPAM|nr:protein MEMO1-like [Amphibalanus amphitrite]XP_043219911.1 protein MEMO1-like [Amphibalanus amphitrite]XP_043219912.1 protein MEMO1-like [Amphibalanus amphitrite]XP_043219913.1 protein MEMO1-like [Amphibalanus amphitrite]XP_043219914.1 protein MEMO1-like [Amphibalanus amphitrite]XP_043219916.1 protein MEMO1-like [Amphibalanus amphitrite]XP_043219917.1 protein MEMO1-like [Amphibalanus amphitrite]XP_043219918.1 protein MEMO1-like [Amphibalanus amphitrite]XP_043219919.1 protein MEMO1-like [
MSSIRKATHAGSWYSNSERELGGQLERWLDAAELSHGPARAIIAPHAGYSYCGACGAFAYRQVSPICVKRVFILGPSHHVRLAGCALSSTLKYSTPLYDLTIDQGIYDQLYSTEQFERMSLSTDEDEHSIEMHLPYIAKVMEDFRGQFTIVPILVGSLTPDKEALYGRLLAPYLADPANLFVISSDFCHWGQRFRYVNGADRANGHIHEFIQQLDREGMDIIESLDPVKFTQYIQRTGNTICGRHPIGVLLNAVAKLNETPNGHRMKLKFLKYAQSSQCRSPSDSSVSYASASLIFE